MKCYSEKKRLLTLKRLKICNWFRPLMTSCLTVKVLVDE